LRSPAKPIEASNLTQQTNIIQRSSMNFQAPTSYSDKLRVSAALAVLTLANTLAHAAPVWNVNMGNLITTSDNFAGAAVENTTPNSFWNSITNPATPNQALSDSTGAASSATVTFASANSMDIPTYATLTSGIELFSRWLTSGNSPLTMTIGGLSTSSTYDLIVYSDWFWNNGDAYPVTQTVGTGLTGTARLDHIWTDPHGQVPALVEDTDPSANTSVQGNWIRITGLTPDASGVLAFSMGGVNSALNGLQLIQIGSGAPDDTPPTPSPMTWASAPAAASSTSITMTATTASDASGVEYYFDETSGHPGGSDSGWQNSPIYVDTGLNASTSYTYTVLARDRSTARNETLASGPASATTNPPPSGTVVWNVNIGNQVTTADNYAGAVPQSSPINWNSLTTSSYNGLALMDSTGSVAGGITLDLTSDRNPGSQGLTSGDKIFIGYFGGAGAESSFTLRGLTIAKTYDIVFYSDWYWKDAGALPVTQTAGTGLTSTFFINQIKSVSNGIVPALTQDNNPADTSSGAGNIGNYCRIVGIVPDTEGKVSFRIGDGVNSSFSGFQLVQTGEVTPRADILGFTLASNPPSIREAVINGTNITLTVPYNTNVTALAPTFVLWPGATTSHPSGTSRNFTTPQTYTITSSDSLVIKNYVVSVAFAPPLPEFTLIAPANWDGRTTINVQPNISNLALLQSTGGTNFTYQWSIAGVAVSTQITPGVLTMTRAQGSGPMLVTLTMTNGTEGVTSSTTIQVQEPASDPWVERTPVANEKPVNGQFFARNPATNQGTIHYRGTQSGSPTDVFLKVYRTPNGGSETLDATYRQPLVSGAYSFSAPITAGLATYRVVYGTRTSGVDTNVATVTGLLCGDAFIIMGQSNAQATANDEPVSDTSNPWLKTYDADIGWGPAIAKPATNWGSKVGFWGMKLGQDLVAQHSMPICLINGALGGTPIASHQPNPTNPALPLGSEYGEQTYSNLFNRVNNARLTHGIRGIFWHQGENDSGTTALVGPNYLTYEQNFINLTAAWIRDYPNVQRYVIYQMAPNPCGIGPFASELREVQRTLPRLYSKMTLMHNHGLAGYDGCHYTKLGYDNMAARLLPAVNRDFYGITPAAPVTPPNLVRAYFTSSARTAIALEFDQAMSWNGFSVINFFINDAANLVNTGSSSGNIVTLQLASVAPANATLDYIKDTWNFNEAPFTMLSGANNIPALTFANVAIGAGSPYQLWASAKNLSGPNAADTADPDADGMSNQEEFAFGLDPNSGASANPITQQLDKSSGMFKYTRTKDSGLTYKVYYSTTLSGWTLDAAATQSPAPAVAGVETVTVTLAAAAPLDGKLFVRVEATP
jgi:hypothetical protein